MGTFHDARVLAAHQKAKANRLAHTLAVEHTKLADDCKAEAIAITSGTTSTKELAKMGHPYGRRSGSYSDLKTMKTVLARQRTIKNTRMKLPALPINKQTGRLQSAMKFQKRTGGSAVQTYVFQIYRNIAPYAKYVLSLGGTVKMTARPFWQHLYKFWKKRNFDLLIKMREESRK